ncbi:hypothetical protein INT50_08930 [Vibrio diabolicus]|uniref:hypothetical protein n=2 Tax=Vibrio diabolicus subgroup TaxID=2315253 RepID=UPI0013DE7F2B|nr:hypothetical protein [Vibrio diabolicus]QOV28705.1 hypothetical protein INT50_08365 [Vibrio diabolicus]QOV28807.1 hypothetical protein INT50_08930 [Vibrio diabolicus]
MELQNKKLQGAILGDGAEYFVAGQIMLNLRMLVSIAPTAAPSWDLEVTNPENGKSLKVQVKYQTRHNRNTPHLRLRSGIHFDILILVESPLESNLDFNSHADIEQKWAQGLQNALVPIYPTWVIDRERVESLMYKSTHKDKGFMVRSFRKQENLFNWQIIMDKLG